MRAAPPGPIAVWDVRDPEESAIFFFANWEGARTIEASRWLEENVPELSTRVIRVEFHLIDVPFAIVTRYELNERGAISIGGDGRALISDPVTVVLRELPPECLLRKEG
jgi:hypothetical protein